MNSSSLNVAVRNAIEVEESAARFYRLLAGSAADDKTFEFLTNMAHDEELHANIIREFALALHLESLPRVANDNMEWVESSPDWQFQENIDFEQAITIALQNEHSAVLHYDALASSTDGDTAAFFESLARQESGHINRLEHLPAPN